MAKNSPKKTNPDTSGGPGNHRQNGHHWTFLTNHAHVLVILHSHPDMVLREVALRAGITERAVQRIIQDLESEGFIQRERQGRNNHYRIITRRKLRHPVEAHRSIGDLLRLIGDGGKATQRQAEPASGTES